MSSFDQQLFQVIIDDCELGISGSVLQRFPLLVEIYDLPSSEIVRMPGVDFDTIGFLTHWVTDPYVLQIMQWNDILNMIRVAVKFQSYRLMSDLVTFRLFKDFQTVNLTELFTFLCFDREFIEDHLFEPFILPLELHTLASMPVELVLFIFHHVVSDLKNAFIISFGDHSYVDVMRRLM